MLLAAFADHLGVTASLSVFRPVVVSSALPLTVEFSANELVSMRAERLEQILAIATPMIAQQVAPEVS